MLLRAQASNIATRCFALRAYNSLPRVQSAFFNPAHDWAHAVQDRLPESWKLDPKAFDQVLSIVQCEGCLYWHLHPADTLYKNPPSHNRPKEASVAIHKLEEALALSKIDTTGLNTALDLGAAPGGWTMLLAQKVRLVLAVDNAELAPEALQLANVVHVKSLAQNAEPHILRHTRGELLDMMVCDMNMHINEAIKPVKVLLSLLRPGAWLIVTLKYFGVGREPRKWEPIIVKELAASGIGDCNFLWTLANTVNERTLIARKFNN